MTKFLKKQERHGFRNFAWTMWRYSLGEGKYLNLLIKFKSFNKAASINSNVELRVVMQNMFITLGVSGEYVK
jgi:hypothetical protein